MLLRFALIGMSALALASCHHPMPGPSPGPTLGGGGDTYPVSNYTCQDGTRLVVRLLGDRASVSVNGAAAVDLPAMGSDGGTFSNGRQTLTIVQGNLSWGLGRAMPSPCSGG